MRDLPAKAQGPASRSQIASRSKGHNFWQALWSLEPGTANQAVPWRLPWVFAPETWIVANDLKISVRTVTLRNVVLTLLGR